MDELINLFWVIVNWSFEYPVYATIIFVAICVTIIYNGSKIKNDVM